jgi:transposase
MMSLSLIALYGFIQTLRRKMASDQRRTPAQWVESERRKTPRERPALFRRNTMDAPYGSPVAGTAERVQLGGNMLAQVERVGAERYIAQALARIPLGTLGSAENQMGRMLCGRKLRFRKKGGAAVGKTKRGKGTKWMVLVDGKGLPVGVSLESASPAEVKLAPKLTPKRSGPVRYLIADRAYDSNSFRAHLAARGIEPIIPARSNNRRATHQDGRKLRRYRRRWIVERTFSWIGWCRRLVVRWERLIEMYRGFFHIALIMLTLRRVLK